MEIFRQLDALPDQLRGGALTIGNFDGVHLGHAAIVDVLKSQARRGGGPAIVFTFDPHPVRLLRPEQTPPPLTWTKRKAELLAEIGVDAVIAYPTDLPLLQLTAKDFFEQIVCKAVAAQAVVEDALFSMSSPSSIHQVSSVLGSFSIPMTWASCFPLRDF